MNKPAARMSELVVRVAERSDKAAFVEIYEHFAPRIKSFLLGKNLSPDAADEVLQEVMLAVWDKARLYKPEKAAVSTWIFTIARNKHVDRIRRESRSDPEPGDPDLQPADLADADDLAAEEQRKKTIRAAMANLPSDQYKVIYMSFMQGLAHAEIAAQLDLPLGTVKSRIRLGFQRLRANIGDVS